MMSLFRFYLSAIILFFFSVNSGFAQTDYSQARKGDKSFDDGRYPDAETSYRKALELIPKSSTSYNLANSMFLQNRIPEAIAAYKKAITSSESPEVKSSAYYNMGNAYFQNNEFEQSIKAYKESLKINPDDEDAKKNLMLAMRQLKQQQQQEQKKENQQQQQQQEEQQQQDQKDQEPKEGESPQQEEKKKEDVSKEEASEILKAIEREDQRVQEKLKKTTGKAKPPIKDW